MKCWLLLYSVVGLTISSEVSKDMVKALAALATYRCACFGIDMNGSHGGIKVCKSDYTEEELKSIVQKYALELINRGALGRYEKDFSDIYKDVHDHSVHTASNLDTGFIYSVFCTVDSFR